MGPRILLVDNVDSFTYNLYQYLGELTGQAPLVVTNTVTVDELLSLEYDCIVLSPGPGHPEKHRDFGICPWLIEHANVPILGICLGHQGIGAKFGAKVDLAPSPMHGRSSRIRHSGNVLFEDIPESFDVIRYHSLLLTDLPDCLEVIAETDDLVMAIKHRERPIWGVQFHPESVGTEYGKKLLANFLGQVKHTAADTSSEPCESPFIDHSKQTQELHLQWREWALTVEPEALFIECFGSSSKSFWLDSRTQGHGMGRFSYLGDLGGPLSASYEYQVKRGQWETDGHPSEFLAGPAFVGLRDIFSKYTYRTSQVDFDFQGGFIGYLGYELKAETEGLPTHQSPYSDAVMFFVDRFCVVDHQLSKLYICALSSDETHSEQERWMENISMQIAALSTVQKPQWSPVNSFTPLKSEDVYVADIHRSLNDIRHGETYEVCLTTQWVGPPINRPLDAYRILRHAHAVPFAAYLSTGHVNIASVSPERFLQLNPDGLVQAKPIKGTAARSDDPDEDRRWADALRESEKDRAENLMIVDLLRNDLGRVCQLGSVRVPRMMEIESYAVHQMVSTVEGQLRSDCDVFDLLQSAFPGGSMTGAPKARTMEILDGLEGHPRGVYSGSIGYISLNGAADFNIVIRTLVMSESESSIGVGGAIVALSDPQNEWAEVLLKVSTVLGPLSHRSGRNDASKDQ